MAVTLNYPAGIKYKPDMNSFRVLEGHSPPIITEFEDGPNLARRQRIGRRAKVAYRIMFSSMTDYDTYRLFEENTLVDGSQRFNMLVWTPTGNTYVSRVVQIERGTSTHEPWGLGMQVSFNLFIYDW